MKINTPTGRVRTSFDPELELPKLHRWFAENPHPSRLTLQMYVRELNGLASRQSRKLLEVHNLCYWFKNARAAYKRAELRMKKQGNSLEHSQLVATQQLLLGQQSGRQHLQLQIHSPQTGANNTLIVRKKSSLDARSTYRYDLALKQSGAPMSLNGQQLEAAQLASPANGGQRPSQAADCKHTDTSLPNSLESTPTANHHLGPSAWLDAQDVDQPCSSSNEAASSSCEPCGSERCSRESSISPSCPTSSLTLRQANPTGVTELLGRQTLLGKLDLASALNCLLSTASNFTVAAAAAAAAAAASSSPYSGPSPQAAGLFGSPSANLAASLLNSNLLSATANPLATPGDPTANLVATLGPRAAPPAVASSLVSQANGGFVDQPIRQLLTAFNPSNFQFALGMLDNKALDLNILNSMSFPTGACAPSEPARLPAVVLPATISAGSNANGLVSAPSICGTANSHAHSHNLNLNLNHRARSNGSRANAL